MNKKIKLNVTNSFFIYFFGVLYTQVSELILPFRISKIFAIIFIFLLSIFIFKQKKLSCRLVVGEFALLILLLYKYISQDKVFKYSTYIIVIAIVILFFIHYFENNKMPNMSFIENAMIIYLLINYLLYISGYSKCIQIDGGNRFKGAFSHANMLANILLVFLLLIFWEKGRKATFVKIMTTLLLLLNGSRTYIICSIIILFAQLLSIKKGKIISVVTVILVVGAMLVFSSLKIFDFVFYRFTAYGFSNNGRAILVEIYINLAKKFNFIDLFIGNELGDKYLRLSPTYYGHGFGENSFLSISILLGYLGVILLIIFFIYLIVKSHFNLSNYLCVICVVLSMTTQDTLLSIQGGIALLGGILFLLSSYRHYNIDSVK